MLGLSKTDDLGSVILYFFFDYKKIYESCSPSIYIFNFYTCFMLFRVARTLNPELLNQIPRGS